MSHVFPRVLDRELPEAVAAEGAWITTADGRRFLDGAGGAIVVNVGHGERAVIEAIEAQLARTQYVHGTMFTTGVLEAYADDLAPLLPLDDARLYPVSGGSEAVETALKLARAYHLARGEESRFVVIGRRSAYHGNTLGALDASGKEPLRKPYTPWLGRFLHAPAAYEYRCENPQHPDGVRRVARGGARADDLPGAAELGGGVHRRTGGGRDARRGGPVRGLLALDRRGLPAPRRARDRRRGDDRHGPHRSLVRGRALGRAARHPDRRQGHDERVRAVRVRGGERGGLRGGLDHRVRPRLHVVAQRPRGRRGGRRAAAAARPRSGRARGLARRAAPDATSWPRSPTCRSWATCAGSA